MKPVNVNSPAFLRWFGASKVVDDLGSPVPVYHGTLADFDRFDLDRTNPESDWGRGFYFSNNPHDVSGAYADIAGPDHVNKMERIIDRLSDEMPREEAVRHAARQLGIQHGGAVGKFYLRIVKPFRTGYESEMWGRRKVLRFLDVLERVCTSTDFDINPTEAREAIASGAIFQAVVFEGDDVSAYDLLTSIKETEPFTYAELSDGGLAANEIAGRCVSALGYDGIVDYDVYNKFGENRGFEGMDHDTVHYIVRDPSQIKSAISNRGTYSRRDPVYTNPRRGWLR